MKLRLPTKADWKRLVTRRNLVVVFLCTLAGHLLVLAIARGWIVFRTFHRAPAQFVAPPPPPARLDPRRVELKVRSVDLSKSSGRPRIKARMTANRPSAMSLPPIKGDTRADSRAIQKDFSVFGSAGFGSGIGGGFGTGAGGGRGGGLPLIMSSRCNPSDRLRRLLENGGDTKSEAAVVKGLGWLATHQNGDGSWGTLYPTAMTGLAVLSYLGHCETPDSGPYAKNVGDGIRYLMNVGKSHNGRLYLQDRTYLSYEHAIATFALAEAYSMTRDPEIESALRQALPIIIRAQTQQKGWVYSYGSSGIDTSISGWNIQALKAAVTSGLKLEGLQECLDRAIVGINAMQLPNGDWKYNLSDANWRPHLVGVGVYCLETTPTAYPESIRKGIAFMLAEKDHNPGGAYTWYYNTLACFLRGGIAWRQWNDIFQQEMIRTQRADGSWPTRADSPGAKEDQPIYDTCFATLMLEVYYRYLPSSK